MKLLGVLAFLLLFQTGPPDRIISNYELFTGWGVCRFSLKEVIILRKFLKADHNYYLTVSPLTLNPEVIRSDSINPVPATWETLRSRYSETPYMRALKQAEILGDTLQDAGFTRFISSKNGIDLTIDLCPSQRPLDRIVFTDLIEEIGRVEKPVPLAISITGRWMRMHPDDLKWLDSLERSNDLAITWSNHSYNHYTFKDVPLKRNFMLAPGTQIDAEVLNTEIALLQMNIVPSVFFRFPGLVSDHSIYVRILRFGLIPVGSDAWLAKGQWPKNGSIVLIHANGNEPLGVKDFLNLLRIKRDEVLSKRWELFDLRESIVEDKSR